MFLTHDWALKSYIGSLIVVVLCAHDIFADTTYCDQLHLDYKKNDPQRTLSILGHDHSLSVYWDGSETSLAAAALLLTVLRHGLRYRLVGMSRSQPGLCSLQAERERLTREDGWPDSIIMAPSIGWNELEESGCTTSVNSGRLQVLSAGAAPISLGPQPRIHHTNSDANQTIRIADVTTLRQFAPSVLEVFGRFRPDTNVIREVLDWKASHAKVDIAEAACAWAKNNTNVFEKWLTVKRIRVYEVVVFLCHEDPESVINENLLTKIFTSQNSIYQKMASKFSKNTNLKLRFLNVDCADEYSLMRKFMARAHSVYWPRLVGAVVCGMGTPAAANVASALDTPLVLYDITTESGDGPLMKGARSSTGRLTYLVLAFQYFLKSCQWTRLAIISEETKLASDFAVLLSAVKSLTVKDVSIKAGVTLAVRTLYDKDARIIFINGNADVAISVLCEAYELGMLNDTSYVWILREWRSEDLRCGNTTIRNDFFFHFTISFWWRGGNNTASIVNSNQNHIYEKLENLFESHTWPQRIVPLVDATTILIHGFYNLLQHRPHSLDDLHSADSYRFFWKFYESKPTLGIMQQLSLNQQTLSDPFIYIYKWRGKQQQLQAVWQIDNDSLLVIHQKIFFEGRSPSDGRRRCWTVTAGDKFAPHCHDIALFTTFVAVAIAVPAALLARRTRLEQIAHRDRVLTAELLARGRRASAALAAHLVDRATLQIGREIGAGRFGRVEFATLRPPGKPPLVVAVKSLRDEATQAEEREFLNEAVILASLSHQHIVRLIGVCATGGPPLVLMEHAFFGDLLKYLRERRHLFESEGGVSAEAEQVSAPALTRLAHQAATALDYLRRHRLVHRDVRASNCLVDTRRSLKLADFGLARKMESGATGGDEEYLGRRRGFLPALWMAPESLECGVFTAASDAWALGVLLLELATLGARPYGSWPAERVMRYVCAGGYPPLPMDVTPDLRRLLLQCWRRVPAERASAAELARELNRSPAAIRPALQPPKPDECCHHKNID